MVRGHWSCGSKEGVRGVASGRCPATNACVCAAYVMPNTAKGLSAESWLKLCIPMYAVLQYLLYYIVTKTMKTHRFYDSLFKFSGLLLGYTYTVNFLIN